MTWFPIAYLPPQFVDANGAPYSGAVLKAYAAETSTPIPMATTFDGSTTVTSVALNALGFTTYTGSVIIPHVSEDFKLALYPTQAAADANSGELWSVDDIKISQSTNSSFFQAFSGDGSTTDFTLSQNLGTDEKVLMVFTSDANTGFFQKFSGDGTTVAFTLSQPLGTDESEIEVFLDSGIREKVSNGDFASDTIWTKGAGWTIAAGVATATGGISTTLSETAALPLKQYELYDVTFTMTRSLGSIVISLGGGTAGTSHAASGTYTEQIIAGSAQDITFTPTGFTGTIDNVTVKPVRSAGYEPQKPTDYTIAGTTLTFGTAPGTGVDNIYVYRPIKSGTGAMNIHNPVDYTLTGTTLSFVTAPSSGTNNIMVFAPSILFGTLGDIAAACATSETNAANSATAAAASATAAAASLAAIVPLPMSVVIVDTQAVNNNSYVVNANNKVVTLPTNGTVGKVVEVSAGPSSNGFTIAQNALDKIYIEGTVTTTGVAGSIVSGSVGDSIVLKCIVAPHVWMAFPFNGNLTVN